MTRSLSFKVVEIETDSYHLIVDAHIGDVPVKLIVDTGASRSVIDKSFDSGIRVEGIDDTVAVGFMSSNVNIELALIPSLIVGGIKFDDFPIALADLTALQDLYSKITGFSVDGLLGCDFLVKNITSINFRTKKIYLKQNLK